MKLIKTVLAAAFAITTIGAVASPGKAAPLPTNVAAMTAVLDTPVLQVRYGRWHGGWGHRGWGGYRGWGYGGYRGWGLGAVAAGAVVGGAIASSAYHGGAYPSDGGDYGYGGGYASDYCSPYGYGDYHRGYGAPRYYYGW